MVVEYDDEECIQKVLSCFNLAILVLSATFMISDYTTRLLRPANIFVHISCIMLTLFSSDFLTTLTTHTIGCNNIINNITRSNLLCMFVSIINLQCMFRPNITPYIRPTSISLTISNLGLISINISIFNSARYIRQ